MARHRSGRRFAGEALHICKRQVRRLQTRPPIEGAHQPSPTRASREYHMANGRMKHEWATRVAHMALALAVGSQLLTSLFSSAPRSGSAGNAWFDVHETGGLAAFGFVLAFWLVLIVRRRGTEAGLLFPWLDTTRLNALWVDTKRHLTSLRRLRLPHYDEDGALAGAVHGLGILLISAMAASGTLYYLVNSGNPDAGGIVGATMFVHRSLANLVWAYLFGHAGLAVIHHYAQGLRLSEMWSLRRERLK